MVGNWALKFELNPAPATNFLNKINYLRRGPARGFSSIRSMGHDLALLRDAAEKSEKFPGLVMSAMQHDDRRSKNNTAFSGLPVAEKFQQMFGAFDRDSQYRSEYDLFVKGVSYAPEGEVPDFDAAMDAVRQLTKIVAS